MTPGFRLHGILLFLVLSSLMFGCVPTQTKVIKIDRHAKPSGKFTAPLEHARMLSPFGTRGRSYHTGVDLKNSSGKILATRAGTVSHTRVLRGYGKTIEIQHSDGFISRYAHLKKILVKQGAKVKQGTHIGMMGNSGRASTPHLHFEILTPEKRFTDPCEYIQCKK